MHENSKSVLNVFCQILIGSSFGKISKNTNDYDILIVVLLLNNSLQNDCHVSYLKCHEIALQLQGWVTVPVLFYLLQNSFPCPLIFNLLTSSFLRKQFRFLHLAFLPHLRKWLSLFPPKRETL